MEFLDKNLLRLLAIDLDLPSLAKLCATNKRIEKEICGSEDFWRNKLYKEYPNTRKIFYGKLDYRNVYREFSKPIKAIDEEVVKTLEKQLQDKIVFSIMDNYRIPFYVEIKRQNKKLNAVIRKGNNEEILTFENVDTLWVGTSSFKGHKYIGNICLLIQEQRCISIASSIIEFYLKENEYVTRYIVNVGHNEVSYGWIETNLGYYALSSFNCIGGVYFLDKIYQPKESDLDCWTLNSYPFKNAEKVAHKILIKRLPLF